ncbi:MAG: alanine racemase [Anaerolineales bacterium]|nr:alanine racemase [Anaerolineales bacterium]
MNETMIRGQQTRPTLLLAEAQARRNLQRMVRRVQLAGGGFRPHFKTHQAAELGEWFGAEGVRQITVSSLYMARYFADHGWDDITVAVPVNVAAMAEIRALARRVKLGVLVESPTAVSLLSAHCPEPLTLWIEADVGYRRTGVWYEDVARYVELCAKITAVPHFQLAGLLTHAGHSYEARGEAEITAVHETSVARLLALQSQLASAGYAGLRLSVGDTPTCSVVAPEKFTAVDEMRPGNFIFYDLMMANIGACQTSDIAVAVACPIIALYPERGELIVHGGAVHFGKERLTTNEGEVVYGYATSVAEGAFSGADERLALVGLSQEHGTVRVRDAALFERFALGDRLLFLPVHSCLTADLYDHYTTLHGRVFSRLPRQF